MPVAGGVRVLEPLCVAAAVTLGVPVDGAVTERVWVAAAVGDGVPV